MCQKSAIIVFSVHWRDSGNVCRNSRFHFRGGNGIWNLFPQRIPMKFGKTGLVWVIWCDCQKYDTSDPCPFQNQAFQSVNCDKNFMSNFPKVHRNGYNIGNGIEERQGVPTLSFWIQGNCRTREVIPAAIARKSIIVTTSFAQRNLPPLIQVSISPTLIWYRSTA